MNIYELNEKYFELYSRLNDNREFVSSNAYKAMSKALDKMYDDELNGLIGSLALDTAETAFIQRFRIRKYIPRRGLFGYNRIGKAFMRRCKDDFRAYLEELLSQGSPEESPQEDAGVIPEAPVTTTDLIVSGSSEVSTRR